MDTERQPTRLKLHYPPAEFWRALLAFRIHAFARGLDLHAMMSVEKYEGSLRHAVDIVDIYLDDAIGEGWLDD